MQEEIDFRTVYNSIVDGIAKLERQDFKATHAYLAPEHITIAAKESQILGKPETIAGVRIIEKPDMPKSTIAVTNLWNLTTHPKAIEFVAVDSE